MLALITALLPLAANLTPLLMQLLTQVRAQPGMDDDAITAHVKATLGDAAAALMTERLRLLAEIEAPGGD